jgi:hypothetical protein
MLVALHAPSLVQVLLIRASQARESARSCQGPCLRSPGARATFHPRRKGSYTLPSHQSQPTPCGLEPMLSTEELGGPLANDDAGSHGVAGGYPWQDRAIGHPQVGDAIDVQLAIHH